MSPGEKPAPSPRRGGEEKLPKCSDQALPPLDFVTEPHGDRQGNSRSGDRPAPRCPVANRPTRAAGRSTHPAAPRTTSTTTTEAAASQGSPLRLDGQSRRHSSAKHAHEKRSRAGGDVQDFKGMRPRPGMLRRPPQQGQIGDEQRENSQQAGQRAGIRPRPHHRSRCRSQVRLDRFCRRFGLAGSSIDQNTQTDAWRPGRRGGFVPDTIRAEQIAEAAS